MELATGALVALGSDGSRLAVLDSCRPPGP
jgi:hypothetical protein